MKLKLIKKSITLPEELYDFAESEAKIIARRTGSPENVSAFMREVLTREKERKEALNKQQKEAA